MVDPIAVVAVVFLLAGVLGSVLPLLPGAPLSLVGVYLYWWNSGYADPGPIVLVGLTALGLLAVAAEYAGGAVSARFGGASNRTVVLATVVGIVAFFVTGPLGLLAGVAGTVFASEFYRHRDVEASLRAAAYATVGVFASNVVQVLLTATMLVAFALAVFV